MVLKKKNASDVQNSKPFYLLDVAIYAFIAIAVFAAFFIVFLTGKKPAAQGFTVIYDNRTVAEYTFGDERLAITDGFNDNFTVNAEGIYFFPDAFDRSEYNLIVVDDENKTVVIKDATCAGKDCESQTITEDGGFIYCAPHKLKIVPTGLFDPVAG